MEQRRTLQWLVYWFWRDLSEFNRAMVRGRLWTAHGLLEALRLKCVSVARLKHEFFSVGMVGYEGLEQAADAQDLAKGRRHHRVSRAVYRPCYSKRG